MRASGALGHLGKSSWRIRGHKVCVPGLTAAFHWTASPPPELCRQATQGEHLANCAHALEPGDGRLVAYLERRTPWDS